MAMTAANVNEIPGQPRPRRAGTRAARAAALPAKIDRVVVRMYCLGTGDCFVLKFCAGSAEKFTMMIDCGSCRGTPLDFRPYLQDLVTYIQGTDGKGVLDLLVVTHEHQDHVNGFAKCPDLFELLTIKEAWFAWTENPEERTGLVKQLKNKEAALKVGFKKAMAELGNRRSQAEKDLASEFYQPAIIAGNDAFLEGLRTLADVNLEEANPQKGESLAGMVKIKDILKKHKVKTAYLMPGEVRKVEGAAGVNFYVLGPPVARGAIFKEGKEGRDVYHKRFALRESALAATAFNILGGPVAEQDLPFGEEYIMHPAHKVTSLAPPYGDECQAMVDNYQGQAWRKIDNDWLSSAGTLAIRLNSHINNTSLALAIELEDNQKKVLLFPGDAEFGNWESWHEIEKWKEKGKEGKPLIADLLSRTVFYKVSHHLSYNGTALKKGIELMDSPDLAAMVTLDRKRIASKWKSTMPNKHLLEDLIKRCQGRVFFMDEAEVDNPPSATLDPATLPKYQQVPNADGTLLLCKQYTVD